MRPLHDRYAAGVCAGLARLTGTDPLLWRVLLAVSALFGVGVLLYLALWLVTPAEGDTGSPLEALLGRGHSRTSGTLTVLLALGVVVGLGGTLDNSAGMLVIGAAIVLGIVLLAGRHGTMPDPVRHLRQAFPPPAPAGAADPAFPPGAWTPGGPTGPPPPAGPTGPAVPAGYTGGFPFGGPADPVPPGGPMPPAGAGGAVSAPPAPHTGGDAVPAPPPWGVPHGPPFAPHGPWRHGAGGHGTRRWHGMGFGHRTTAPAEPPPAEARPPRPRRQRSPLGLLTVSLTLLLLAGVAIADLAQAWSPHPGTYVAVAVGMTGLGLVIGAWFGRARLLIVLGTVLALGLGGAGGAERWDDELRQPATVWVPTSAAELQPVYERRLGAATLDLRQVDFTGRQHTVTAIVEFGSMRILVPPAVTVTTVAHTRAGRVTVFGDEYRSRGGGPVRRHDVGAGGPRAGALELHLTARGANLEVIR
ncbi:MAG TPA: PspC domain-containing protein [Pilimelia sp.]|nr:PspC domain-containing protein [Pilimelia sp.]